MKILILEPHGDDALLSCNSILDTDNDIDILTFADYRSSEELKNYYNSIKCTKYLNNNNLWYPEGKFPLNTRIIHKDYINGINVYDKFIDFISDKFRESYYNSIELSKNSLLREVQNLSKYDIVLCPSGIVHPYHLVINRMWNNINKEYNIPTIYYADKYYIQNRYGKELFNSSIDSMNLKFSNKDILFNRLDTPNRKISDILCKVYPTESKLLRFYNDIIEWYKCVYAYNTNDKIKEIMNELE